jgi:peptidoglycan/LPS O-acetylase OafA/YrhL
MVVALGEASYALYILQEPVAFIFRAALEHSWAVRQHHTYWNFNTWLMVGIYVGILIAASLLSMRFVERPLRRVIRTRFARRAEVRHGVPPVLATSSEPA